MSPTYKRIFSKPKDTEVYNPQSFCSSQIRANKQGVSYFKITDTLLNLMAIDVSRGRKQRTTPLPLVYSSRKAARASLDLSISKCPHIYAKTGQTSSRALYHRPSAEAISSNSVCLPSTTRSSGLT